MLAGLGLALLAGCAATKMESTWVDPGARGTRLSRVAVFVMSQDEGMRRMAEDRVVAELRQTAQVMPSYQALQGVDMKDRQQIVSRLRSQGFDGILIMRVTDVDEELSRVPVSTFDGYYGWAWPAVYGPGYLDVETNVRVMSSLYDVNTGKLLWAGTSSTFDPSSFKQIIDEVSKEVEKDLQKQMILI